MRSLPDILRTLAPRLVAVVLLLALTTGVRAQMFIGTYLLKVTPVTAQAPVEEEEEHRHDAKGKASATDRRKRDDVPPPDRKGKTVARPSWHTAHGRTLTPTRVLPDRECDLRNGIGAPLRC